MSGVLPKRGLSGNMLICVDFPGNRALKEREERESIRTGEETYEGERRVKKALGSSRRAWMEVEGEACSDIEMDDDGEVTPESSLGNESDYWGEESGEEEEEVEEEIEDEEEDEEDEGWAGPKDRKAKGDGGAGGLGGGFGGGMGAGEEVAV